MPNEVVALFICPDAEGKMRGVREVHTLAGRGLEGDRYYAKVGTYSQHEGGGRQVTLIESEAVAAVGREAKLELDASESRRNIVTRGVALNHLVDREFRVGGVRLRGVRLCEPCEHLESLVGRKIRAPLIHRGGLRADILDDGVIRVGDRIEADE